MFHILEAFKGMGHLDQEIAELFSLLYLCINTVKISPRETVTLQ